MNLVIPSSGLLIRAQLCWGVPTAVVEDFLVDLYTNDLTPTVSTTLADLDLASFAGYAQVAVPRSSFGSATLSGNDAQITSSTSVGFTCSGGSGQTVYGCVIHGATSGAVYGIQPFADPIDLTPGITEFVYPFTFSETWIS